MHTKSVYIRLMPTKESLFVLWAVFHLPTFSWFRNRAMASPTKAETAAECEDCGTANWPCGWAEGPVCFLCVAVRATSYLMETDD